MSKVAIPKRFKIFGQTIEIEFQDDLVQKEDNCGGAHYRTNKIIIQNDCAGLKRTQEQIEKTYLHEVIHFILYELHEEKLRDDEAFVDRVASALHQILQTAEY